MRNFMSLLILLIWASTQIWAQKKQPEEKSIVNKQFDENGNLIQYDSTYVWQWNSDSTMNFSFDDNFAFGKAFPGFFGEFNADSMFTFEFPFEQDSIFGFDFGNQFPGSFDFRELEDLQKQFQEQFKQHSFRVPEFKSPEQQDEWEKLMQKQQKEKEELLKKWKQ